MRTSVILIAVLALAACGSEKGAGGLTAEDSRRLNEAAAMLDEPSEAERGNARAAEVR